MKICFILIFSLLAGVLHAQQLELVDGGVSFVIKNAGFNVNGEFDTIPEASLTFFNETGRSKSFTLTSKVWVASIQTGIAIRDKHLLKPDYFNAEVYPWITLEIKVAETDQDGRFTSLGEVVMKGVSGSSQVTGILKGVAEGWELEMEMKLDRLSYDVGGKSLVLSKEVRVKAKGVFSKKIETPATEGQ